MTLMIRGAMMAVALTVGAVAGAAPRNPMVGGAAMYPTKTIVENASQSKDHTTLVAAVKAAGLVDTLSARPVHRVRADQCGIAKLPAGTVDTLVQPENKDKLTSILTYHVIPAGSRPGYCRQAKANGGTATYTTVQGEPIMFKKAMGGWAIMDGKGDTGRITTADVMQSNGVVHVIDTVMMP